MEFASPEEPAASGNLVRTVDTPAELRNRYSLTDADVIELARYAVTIEKHYGRPMDIEWGKDGAGRQLYILQARPETVKSQAAGKVEQRYQLKGNRQARARRRPCHRPEDRHRPGARGARSSPRWTACSPATCWSPT